MNINNKSNNANNISFKSVFAVEGTSSQVRQMCNEIKNSQEVKAFSNKLLSCAKDSFSKEKIETHMVLTNQDVTSISAKLFSPKELFALERRDVLKAEDFFAPDRHSFDPVRGRITTIHSLQNDNFICSYLKKNFLSSKQPFAFHVKTPMTLNEMLARLDSLRRNTKHPLRELYENSSLSGRHVSLKDIADTNIGNLKVTGIIGHGGYSDNYDLGENILKVSRHPICPKEMTGKDLPYLEAGMETPKSGKTFYYCIQPKIKNDFNSKISEEEVKKFKAEIDKLGYEDWGDLGPAQLGRYKDDLYLYDYMSIVKKGKTDREMLDTFPVR